MTLNIQLGPFVLNFRAWRRTGIRGRETDEMSDIEMGRWVFDWKRDVSNLKPTVADRRHSKSCFQLRINTSQFYVELTSLN